MYSSCLTSWEKWITVSDVVSRSSLACCAVRLNPQPVVFLDEAWIKFFTIMILMIQASSRFTDMDLPSLRKATEAQRQQYLSFSMRLPRHLKDTSEHNEAGCERRIVIIFYEIAKMLFFLSVILSITYAYSGLVVLEATHYLCLDEDWT